MFSKRQIKNRLEHRANRLNRQLESYARSGAMEELHMWRKHIKKLRALDAFLPTGSRPRKVKKALADLKSIYAQSGAIREAYLTEQLLSRYRSQVAREQLNSLHQQESTSPDWESQNGEDTPAGSVESELQSNSGRLPKTAVMDLPQPLITPQFQPEVHQFREIPHLDRQQPDPALIKAAEKLKPALKKVQKHLMKNVKNIDTKYTKNYIFNKLSSIEKRLAHRKKTELLHECRRDMKRLVYLYNELPRDQRHKIGLNKDYLHQLEDSIGQWHDTTTAVDYMLKQEPQSKLTLEALQSREDDLLRSIRKKSKRFSKRATRSKR